MCILFLRNEGITLDILHLNYNLDYKNDIDSL